MNKKYKDTVGKANTHTQKKINSVYGPLLHMHLKLTAIDLNKISALALFRFIIFID